MKRQCIIGIIFSKLFYWEINLTNHTNLTQVHTHHSSSNQSTQQSQHSFNHTQRNKHKQTIQTFYRSVFSIGHEQYDSFRFCPKWSRFSYHPMDDKF